MRVPYLAAAAVLAAGPVLGATTLPQIKKLTLAAQGDGTYSATIAGTHFGAVPAGIPCSGCTPQQVQVLSQTTDGLLTLNVTGWTNNAITLTGLQAQGGEALEFAVWNATLANAAAGGRLVSPRKGAPHIISVVATGSGANVSVTVTGSGFGPAPSVVGQTTVSPYFMFSDYNAQAPNSGAGGGSGGYPWNAGFCGANECDGVTIGYVSWSDTQIVVSGLAGSYGTPPWYDNPDDAFCVSVWPSGSKSNGTTGGAVKCARLPQ